MQQIKMFVGIETAVGDLEKSVNTWIRESKARVLSIQGNISPQTLTPNANTTERRFAPSDVFVMVVYQVE